MLSGVRESLQIGVSTMNPECVAGRHANCDGTTWDGNPDDVAPCACSCHTHEPEPPPC
ncbi:MAG: hypothetical protein AVDCRST_MAG75-1228 [uncultured Propionibacteriaceae bacterium]|uniref:Uncharacterized protein n=1 Tax=uncultured Propionibacteriaceae bacterium TaxID=257457 RepID=A0A6J4NDU5_9ACTN|nr:MAG: hypothetical protein AVDCRST_MAG75-1228 [uncultured Propionibacteriaceae bacterium]